jgi:hypothetical protein
MTIRRTVEWPSKVVVAIINPQHANARGKSDLRIAVKAFGDLSGNDAVEDRF